MAYKCMIEFTDEAEKGLEEWRVFLGLDSKEKTVTALLYLADDICKAKFDGKEISIKDYKVNTERILMKIANEP